MSGVCVMRGSCGTKGWFGAALPCPYDGPPEDLEDGTAREMLVDLCGSQYADTPVCCTSTQVQTLRDNIKRAELMISSCPACKNNFRDFFCAFTCHPDQGTFVQVTSTQNTSTGQIGVKSVDFHVGSDFGRAFFDSCKDIKFGATNGYAMDLIGGGAKNYTGFFKYLGDEKPVGSPFQIDFPLTHSPELAIYDPQPRNCFDRDLSSRCTCIDCPDVCTILPPLPPSDAASACNIGPISCLTFSLTLVYGLVVAGFLGTLVFRMTRWGRKDRKYERVALTTDAASEQTPLSPRSHTHGLVGASSLQQYVDGDSVRSQSDPHHLGRGASLLDPIDTVQPRHHRLNNFLRKSFFRLGFFASEKPYLTLALVFTAVGLLNIGWKNFEVEQDPVRLWVAPDSESKIQKEYFDQHFGPFYRPQQIFITPAPSPEKEPVLSWNHLKFWASVEKDIRALESEPNGYTLEDVCFKPAGSDGACVVQSVMAWFGNDIDQYDPDTWAERFVDCANAPAECLPDFQQPLMPQYVLGNVPNDPENPSRFLDAQALVVNYVVSDSLDTGIQDKAMEWERTLKRYLLDTQGPALEAGLKYTFSTGVSLEEELNRSANMDVRIVVLSYLAMFFYVSLTLGTGAAVRDEDGFFIALKRWAVNFPKLFTGSGVSSSAHSTDSRNTPSFLPRPPRGPLIRSKVALGLFGISLVILSVSSSVGLFSAIGVKVTLIIAEVIPFLVLAVGVDNVFILVHELDRQNQMHGPNALAFSAISPTSTVQRAQVESTGGSDTGSVPTYLPAEERVARTLGKMGPSILLSTITETIAFSLGALVPMPAVRNFALYAAGSVLLNAFLQVTVFVSALALDLRRTEDNRVDCFPCLRFPPRIMLHDVPQSSGLGRVAKFIRRRYVPWLLKPFVKGFVLVVFMGIFVLSVISIQHIQLGLDQKLALPSESYLVRYFEDMEKYLDIGPPVYFVSRDSDVTVRTGQQHLCGHFTTCDEFSLANVLESERQQRRNSSFIAEPTASWIDDFLHWLDPSKESCCRVRKRNPAVFCRATDPERLCQPCFMDREPAWDITMNGLPEGEEFMKYLQQWLASPTTEDCPLAGRASYGDALALKEGGGGVEASHFRTFHSPLRTQEDFIRSMEAAHRIAEDLTAKTGTSVFPYSIHYVYFDQYLHIIGITKELLGLGLASVLIVTALLLGSWRTGLIVTGVVGLTIVSVMGVMGVWGINLNAVSLVNLVISLGIAVEFCAHVARAFMNVGSGLPIDHPSGQKERDERMGIALVDVGPSVLSGITFTKLIGMSVLALTRSKLLEMYYFRMWLTLIISGALHGLVLLPVVLSLAGGAGFPTQEIDEEWVSNVIRNDYEYA
ncbi:patched family-domain-containing protein [Thelephora terrestris]|uniref:Patched family-domain-containing protein n=1 Tax=Thelephora terrestris TaxID=56493 RepID=A0A9P6HAQ4_9AGAM|nr:patched family-domain-containing protein [Thelephora terrestris]